MTTSEERKVVKTVGGELSGESGALQFRRLIGIDALPRLDPFLTFHEITSDGTDGDILEFASHPHRGFEIVTHMFAGNMRHSDPLGNTGRLASGSVQWLTTGRGIIHSEKLERENGAVRCTQLWLNLPARDKMVEPVCSTIDAAGIPVVQPNEGARIGVIAGAVAGGVGPVQDTVTGAIYLDIELGEGARTVQDLPIGHAAFAYVLDGRVAIGPANERTTLPGGYLGVLSDGPAVTLAAEPFARLLLVAGRPIGEPVVQHGPFVMNTDEEIQQAIADYQEGRF